MIHPHTELQFISEKIGYGVIATKFIPKGTITWVLDKLDRIFTPEEVRAMDPLLLQVLRTPTLIGIQRATITFAALMLDS